MNSLKFLDLGKSQPKKIKSICLEIEPILEELEEYQAQDLDLKRNQSVVVPQQRNRMGSVDISQQRKSSS